MDTVVKTADVASGQSRRWEAFQTLLLPAVKAHAPLLIALALHLAFAAGLYFITPGMVLPALAEIALSFSAMLGVLLPLSIATLRFYHLATKIRPKHPIPALLRDMCDYVSHPERAANGTVLVLIFAAFVTVFTYLKGVIPLMNPYSWDKTFMEWDRWLHFGYHPWELLQPFLGHPLATLVVTGFYHLWFMAMWIMVAGLAFGRVSPVLRMQFFLAFMLTWIVGGNVLAMVFSSVGPCYYGLMGYMPDPFAPLMSYLHGVHETIPIWAVDTQAMLWKGYLGEGLKLGISAMPSMHNGAALLLVLVGMQINRKLGIGLLVFTAIIFLGSIHLGWHYAIDGYAGFAITIVAWWISGLIAKWWATTGWSRDYERLRLQLR